MMIDKQQILDMLMQKGDQGTAHQAESELPDQIDTDKHSGLLEKLGINVQDLLGGLGGLGGAAGGLGGLAGGSGGKESKGGGGLGGLLG